MMKKKDKNKQKKKGARNAPERDIEDLIDDIAYLSKSGNIKKSKSFLDNIYLLDD